MLSLFDGSSFVRDRVEFWNDVYGFEMKAMKEEIPDDALIEVVNAEDTVSNIVSLQVRLITKSSNLFWMLLTHERSLQDIVTQTVTVPELTFSTPFSLTATKSTTVNAFLGHFDTFFTTDGRLASANEGPVALKDSEVFFTTGSHGTPTHWKQTIFLLREPIKVSEGMSFQALELRRNLLT
jgi:protein arginine N-methyltransferase 3